MAAVLTDCDGILMLRGWEQSKGAKLEFDVATSCGLEVWYQYRSPAALLEGNTIMNKTRLRRSVGNWTLTKRYAVQPCFI